MSLEHGIVLTERVLMVFGKEILLADVLRAKIVRLTTSTGEPLLAVDYRRKDNVATSLLSHKSVENIQRLSAAIGNLKGWPRQETIPWRTWREWRRTRKSLLTSCPTSPARSP